MNITRSLSRGLSLFLLVFAVLGSWESRAQTAWTNTLGGNWSEPGNWNPNVVPGPATNVFVTNTFGSSYTVTGNVLNAIFEDLTAVNLGAGTATLLVNTNGFNATGDAVLGQRAVLNLNSFDALIGGSLTISNLGSVILRGSGAELSVIGGGLNSGTILINTNAILNIGGTDQASANASSVTFTNLGTITFGRFTNTLNASTATVGIVNQGTIKNDQVTPTPISTINAVVFNDVGGLITSGNLIADHMTFHAIPTNRGTITFGSGTQFQINNGDIVNEGTLTSVLSSPGNQFFKVAAGSIINTAGAVIQGNASKWIARSILNQGTIIVSNTSGAGIAFEMQAAVTNLGTILVYRPTSATFNDRTMAGSNIVNFGTITAIGTGELLTNNLPVNAMTILITNMSGGTIIASNSSLTVFDTTHHGGKLKNFGTVIVESNSVVASGAFLTTSEGRGKITVGLRTYQNDGTIILNDGLFGASLFTNAAGATLQGRGDVGRAQYTNMISGSGMTTNFVRQFETKNIINAGTIAPNGVFNAGIVTNLAGGQIVGFGSIQSVNVTNYYDGETLVVSNYNTGARIQNNAGATILASGGTLVLSNGLFNNSNAGTIGSSNGVLQIGDGTIALTNNGTISVRNGGIVLGDLRNNDTVQIVNSAVTFSNPVINAGRYTSGQSTNTFLADHTVTENGTLEGGNGDRFEFQKNLFITSSNAAQFDLSLSTVAFTGDIPHTNAVTGLDLGGTNEAPFVSGNFAYGALRLGSAFDEIFFTNLVGDVSATALYARWVDLLGDTNNVENLHSPFNIYYAFSGLEPNNAYLNDQTYSLDGGGFLLPAIPEPSTLTLLAAACLTLISLQIRKRRNQVS